MLIEAATYKLSRTTWT